MDGNSIRFRSENNRESKTCTERSRSIQNLKWAGFLAVLGLLVGWVRMAQAQQPTKVPLIGYLGAGSPSTSPARYEAFRQGLRELRYVEGNNIVTEDRWAEGKRERLFDLATELVRLKVDVIVTGGPTSTRPAQKATKTIPIVMAQDSDPVRNGFVASLARPGGNITGLSYHYPEISGKQLELLKEIIPKLSRVAVVRNPAEPGHAESLREVERAAAAFGVKLQYVDVRVSKDIETAFRAASEGRANALLILSSSVTTSRRAQIADLAAQSRLPAIFPASEYVEAGGLMTYGVERTDLFQRAASYVDKILKGANPATLPVEQPTKFELIINLKTANQIGLTIPPNILTRADKVIR